MNIDAHQHFWKYSPGDFSWISDEMAAIRRDFLPQDLKPLLTATGMEGTVAVQAQQAVAETEWLLALSDEHPFILGVVGWAPLTSPSVEEELARLSEHPKFKGVRHILQAEPQEDFMLREDFQQGISCLSRLGLAYDILIYERHLPQTLQLVDRNPQQVFVLDHMAKPRIRENIHEPWKKNIQLLAQRENVYCKLSGLVTEADPQHWVSADLAFYMETVLEAFGPRRLLFGSDWPVCTVGCSYLRWYSLVEEFVSRLSGRDQYRILGGTAQTAYRLA